MRYLIELEGVLCDVQPGYWWAYCQAAAEAGTARTDPVTFWRLWRSAAPLPQLIRQATAKQHGVFEQRMKQLLEDDETINRFVVRDGSYDHIAPLGQPFDRALISLGVNRAARQQLIDAGGLTDLCAEMEAITQHTANRGPQLLKLTAGQPATLIASSELLIRSACLVDISTIAVGTGTCTLRRLMQAGASQGVQELSEIRRLLTS